MVPKQMDIVWLKVDRKYGYEAGAHSNDNPYRPVLVLSRQQFNRAGVIECMPITGHKHPQPGFSKFFIPADVISGSIHNRPIHGFIYVLQLSCYDYVARNGRIIGRMNPSLFSRVMWYAHKMFYLE